MPNDIPTNTGSEVQIFIENTLNQIKKATENSGFVIKDAVEFDLEVTEKKEVGGSGGFKQVIQIIRKKEGESSQRVKFSAKPEKDIQVHSIKID